MLWVDHPAYYGPNRRRAAGGLRMRDRRRENYAGAAPTLETALRQLRMHVIDCTGQSAVAGLAQRVRGISLIADAARESEIAGILKALAATLLQSGARDIRPHVYDQLDRIHGAVRTFNVAR
jgi:hypothetical protein